MITLHLVFLKFDQIVYFHLCCYVSDPWIISDASFPPPPQFWLWFFDTECTGSVLFWDCISPLVLDGCPYEMPLLSLIQIQALLIHWVFPSPSYRMGWNTVVFDTVREIYSELGWMAHWRFFWLHQTLSTKHSTYHGNLHLINMNCLITLPRAPRNTFTIYQQIPL